MATLYFKVASDWEEVVRLRNEIIKLENQLKRLDTNKSPDKVRELETQLASAKRQMSGFVSEAATAANVLGNDLKRKIDTVTKSSDELSEEIIKQRKIIRETQEDVRILSEQYSKMGKYSPQSASTLAQLNRAKAALNEQRYALGELQDKQSQNRIEVRKLNREYKEFSQSAGNANGGINLLSSSLQRTVAELGGLMAIRQFSKDVLDATGRMQQLQVQLTTILQDKAKADALIQEVTQFAAKTPFNLDDVAAGTKQLLAYGSSAETVVDELSMLGDVAAGLQIPIGQLIYLYGTLRTQGHAMTVDIKQFAGRGIPIYEELAKVLGVSKDEVSKFVTEGKVGFAQVEQAFKNMTSEGGKFYNLMENSAGTWPQRISNIQDKLFQKLNDFGNKYKEVFEFGIGTADELVEHLDDIIAMIGSIIAAYGAYRAAVIALAAAHKIAGIYNIAKAFISAARGITTAKQAMIAFNTATKLNPIGLILSAVAAAVTYFTLFADKTNKLNKSMVDLKEVTADYQATVAQEKSEIDRLFGTLEGARKGTTQYEEAKNKIISQYKPYLQGLINEQGELTNLEAAYNRVTAAVEASAKARAMENANTEAAKTYGERNKELIKQLEENLGDFNLSEKQIQAIITRVTQSIATTGKAPDDIRKRFPWVNNTANEVLNNTVTAVLNDMEKQYSIYHNDLEKIEQAFGTQSVGQEAFSSMTDNQLTANIEALKNAQSKLTDATNGVYVELYNYGKKVGVTISSLDELYLSLGNYEKELKRRNAEKSTGTSNDIQSDISKEVESATKRIKVLKQEIADLRRGKMQAEAGKTVESAIEAKTKELQSVQKTLETLTGKKSSKSSSPASGGTDDTVSERLKAEEDLNRMLLDLQKRNQSDEIALMKDGRKKRLAEIEADYEARKAEIAAKAAELAELNRKAGITNVDSNGLTIQQGKDIAKANLLNDRNKTVSEVDILLEERRAMDEYLKEYGNFMEKREAITRQYNERIANATTEGERLSLGREMQDAMKELDFSEFKKSIDFTDVFGNLGELTSGALSDLKDKLSEYINKAASKLRPEDLKELQDAFAKIELEEIDRNPFAGLASSMDDYRTAQDAVEKAQQELDTVLNGGVVITGQYMDENLKLHTELLSVEQAEKNLAKAQSDRQKSLEKVNATINNIGQKGSAVVNSGQQIVGMLENFGVEVPEVVSTTLDGIGQIMQGLASIDITKPFSLITGSISVITGIGNTIAGWFGAGDSKHEKQIQRLQDQIDALDKSYDKLGKSIEKAYSTDASELIEQQNKMLEQQKVLIQQQMAEEEAKKHTDEDKMQEYNDRLEEINELIDDNKEKAIDAIFGEDLQSAIDNFASSYADAWTNGTDKATAARDTVKQMMQQMVQESIKAAIQSSGAMEQIRNKLQQFYADEMLSAWEQDYIYKMADDLQKQLDNQFGWADSLFKEDSAEQQSASSRAFGTEMTQEQGAEISGRLTAMTESNIRLESVGQQQFIAITDIKGSMAGIATQLPMIYNVADESRRILADSYLELQSIRENTGAIVKPIKDIKTSITNIERKITNL